MDVRVVACMLDRDPEARMTTCASTRWTKQSFTDGGGRFKIEGSRHLGVAAPFPHAHPGPFDTNVRFESEGYVAKELNWRDDRETLAKQPLLVELEPVGSSPELKHIGKAEP